MIAEIITIGDELLNGTRVDTNSVFLAGRLDAVGLDVGFITSTGDGMNSLVEAIHQALRRADVILTTGGLGPTDDDITKKAICKVFKRNLIFHENVLEDLQNRFAARGLKMPAINQNQALLPQGAKFLANTTGSALGIVIDEQGKFFCAMPGVPAEMEAMTDRELLPILKSLIGPTVIFRHRIRTAGIMESSLAELIRPALKFAEGVSLAYLPSVRGVDLCVKGVGTVAEEVRSSVALLADSIRAAAGRYIYTEDDRELEEVVGTLLVERNLTIAVAESCTGGLIGGRITSVPGASRYFKGGIVAYADDVKRDRLGVPAAILEQYGAVSAETATAMATGAVSALGADIGLSTTGVAGPTGGSEEKPVGTVFVGLAVGGQANAAKFNLGVDRESIRRRTVTIALEMVRKNLLGIE
jgi:nicotinamide-nucleotide amidase